VDKFQVKLKIIIVILRARNKQQAAVSWQAFVAFRNLEVALSIR